RPVSISDKPQPAQHEQDAADAGHAEAGQDEYFQPDEDKPQHEQQDGQPGDLAVELRVRPEEQDETDGGDDAGQADAGHLQFEEQAGDAEHDQDHADPRVAQEVPQPIEPL